MVSGTLPTGTCHTQGGTCYAHLPWAHNRPMEGNWNDVRYFFPAHPILAYLCTQVRFVGMR